jgi:hypothetical protein
VSFLREKLSFSSAIVILGVAFEYFDLMLVNLMATSIIADFI